MAHLKRFCSFFFRQLYWRCLVAQTCHFKLKVGIKQAENIGIYWRILKNEPFWHISDFLQCQKIRDALRILAEK